MKAMKNPPAGCKLVMASICVMKGVQPEKIPDPAGTGHRVIYVTRIIKVLLLLVSGMSKENQRAFKMTGAEFSWH